MIMIKMVKMMTMLMMMMMMMMMIRIKIVMMMMLLMMSSKNQVVHHDASDKLFGYNTSSFAWQVPKLHISQTFWTTTSEIYML